MCTSEENTHAVGFLTSRIYKSAFRIFCNVEGMNKIRRKEIKKEEYKIKIVTEGNKYV
jgi:hypothetical protein